jgi:hypothetical protein
MAHKRNKDQVHENGARIRGVLMQKWDPIGISRICPDKIRANREYDRYIDTIHLMLLDERTDHQRLTDHLLGLATHAMGLSDRPRLREKCILAAAALLSLRPGFATRRD